jgi:hypothetical protein
VFSPLGEADDRVSPAFTDEAKKSLALALREALQLDQDYVGTEHILLGLVRQDDGRAVQVLASVGVDSDQVRQQVFQHLSGYIRLRALDEGIVEGIKDQPGTPRGVVDVPPSLAPWCPQCHAVLADVTRFRRITVAPRSFDKDEDPISIEVVFCGRCGVSLDMFKSEQPTVDPTD